MNHSEILAQSDEVHEKYVNAVLKKWNSVLSCSHPDKETINSPLAGEKTKPYTMNFCNSCRRMV